MGFWNYRIWRQKEGLTLRETFYNDRGALYAASYEPEAGPAKNLNDLQARVRNLGGSKEAKHMMLRDIGRFQKRILRWPRKRWAKAMFTKALSEKGSK